MQKQARDHDVFPSGQLRPETHAERHEADAVAVHVDRAGIGPEDPGDRAQKRRFSRAVFADDADDLPFPYRKVDAAERSEIEGKLQSLKTALTGTDTAAIKAATEELTQSFYKLSEKLYQQQGGQPGQGFDPSQYQGGQGPQQGGQGQDYYDADYTVVDDDKK